MAVPNVMIQLANSEKFWYVTLLYMLPLTIFAGLGKITVQEWSDKALYALGILVLGKTMQGAAQKLSEAKAARPEARAKSHEANKDN